MTAKRSIYLDDDVYQALKASAAHDRRSMTKQADLLLRQNLGMTENGVRLAPVVGRDLAGPAKPHPKPSRSRSRADAAS